MPDTYCTDPRVIDLCARLRAARMKAGVNGAYAARAMGMTPGRLSALENARTEPRALDIALYVRLTGVPADELVFGDDPSNRELIEVPDCEEARATSPGSAGRARSLQKRREAKARALTQNRQQPVPKPAGPVWRPAAWSNGDEQEAAS